MKIEDLISGTISGAVGGLIVWLLQQWYLNKRENKKEKLGNIIKAKHLDKVITSEILYNLKPGNTIELMKEQLGVPTRFSKVDYPVFTDTEKKTNSYLYLLKNAYLKITSEDNISIDSITIFPHDKSIVLDDFGFLCNEEFNKLNEMKLCKELVENVENHKFIRTMKDCCVAVEYYIPNPLYMNYTYFSYGNQDLGNYDETNDPKQLENSVVNGICISNLTENSYFIYEMEIR